MSRTIRRATNGAGSPADAPPDGPGESAPDSQPNQPPDEGQTGRPDEVIDPAAPFRARPIVAPVARRNRSTGKAPHSSAPARQGAVIGAALPTGRPTALALADTLRAAAVHQQSRREPGQTNAFLLRPADIRVPVRVSRTGQLLLFVVDASGSMAARKRMALVKAAVLSLLHDAYRRRYRVGLIAFRGDDAQLLLPPTSSVDLAERQLRRLPTGGRTPLAGALQLAGEVVARAAAKNPGEQPLLILISDGRATRGLGGEPLADAQRAARGLAESGVPALVIDSEEGPVRLGLAGRLAQSLGAPCLPMADLDADRLAAVIRLGA